MNEFITHFGIDWKLLLAQVVNFFVLLVILRKFVYGPVLKVLKDRKRGIEHGIEVTAAAEAKLKNISELETETLHKAKENALGIVTSAEKEAQKKKEEIVVIARKEVDHMLDQGKKGAELLREKMMQEVDQNAKDFISQGIVKVLGRLSPEEKDRVLIDEALKELRVVGGMK